MKYRPPLESLGPLDRIRVATICIIHRCSGTAEHERPSVRHVQGHLHHRESVMPRPVPCRASAPYLQLPTTTRRVATALFHGCSLYVGFTIRKRRVFFLHVARGPRSTEEH